MHPFKALGIFLLLIFVASCASRVIVKDCTPVGAGIHDCELVGKK